MTIARGLVAVAVRVAAFAAFHVLYLVLLSSSDNTDALGAGLLFFLIVFVVSMAWAGLDALRHGFVESAALWAGAAALTGVALTVVYVVTTADTDLTQELGSSWLFFAMLVFVPAVVGAAVGGAVHRIRRPTVAV